MKSVNRRHILKGGVGAAGLGALGVGGSVLYNTSARLVEKTVRSHLPGLEISDEDMMRFVDDFLAADSDTSHVESLALRIVGPYANLPPFRWMTPRFVSHRLQKYDRRVMNEFMMGTDFFQTYAVGQKRVTYNGIYSAQATPCVDPLPRFPDDADMV